MAGSKASHDLSRSRQLFVWPFRLAEWAKKYDVVKNERNKCLNKIQVCTQKVSEMREKIKILSNEMEILRTSSTKKEK